MSAPSNKFLISHGKYKVVLKSSDAASAVQLSGLRCNMVNSVSMWYFVVMHNSPKNKLASTLNNNEMPSIKQTVPANQLRQASFAASLQHRGLAAAFMPLRPHLLSDKISRSLGEKRDAFTGLHFAVKLKVIWSPLSLCSVSSTCRRRNVYKLTARKRSSLLTSVRVTRQQDPLLPFTPGRTSTAARVCLQCHCIAFP